MKTGNDSQSPGRDGVQLGIQILQRVTDQKTNEYIL